MMEVTKKVEYGDYYCSNIHTWCGGCGNYAIHTAIRRALVAENVAPKDVAMFFDIGCNGNGSDKILGYRMHGLHGRSIPLAVGAHLANRRLKVISFGGDGATLNEGINHLIHAIRSDYNILFVLHNNENFGLTKGQASSATRKGKPMDSSPDGPVEETINILSLVLSLNPTFAARAFSGDVKQMTEIFRRGLNHDGFSVVEVMQSCPSYNKETSHEWYQERVYDAEKLENFDITDIEQAKILATDMTDKVATGVLYENSKGDFYSRLKSRNGTKTELIDEVKEYDIGGLLEKFS